MGIVVLSGVTILLLFSLPLISGLFARRMGRPFLKWFFIGMALPVISVFIIFFLPDLSKENSNGKNF
jgi:MFS family permease